ncbi:MAG: hypothetical protein AAGC84_04100 [Pseudomonas sp.]
MFRFIKTTVLGGVLFILPLALLVILLEKVIHLLRVPLAKVLPLFSGFSVAGVTSVTLAAVVLLLLVCFLAGLLARTAVAANAIQALEDKLLGNLPGYQLLKDAAARVTGMENLEGAKVGMLIQDVGFRFGLVMEARDGWVLIFLADGGPAGLTAGEVQMMPAEQVVITDISWIALAACLRRGGRGALEMAAAYLPPAPKGKID